MPEVRLLPHVPLVLELYVVMYCEACATSVKKAVKKIPGVESYKVDYKGQKVTIVGNVDPEDVLRRVRKTGRQVTLIVTTAEPTTEAKKGDTNEEKKEVEKEETKVKEEEEVQVEDTTTSEGTKVVDTKEEMKVEEVVKVVETKEEVKKEEESKAEEKKEEAKAEPKKEKVSKREPEKPKEPEWVQMFVTAPYYTLPSRFYN